MGTLIRSAIEADLSAVRQVVHDAYAPYVDRLERKPGPMLDNYALRISQGQVQVLDSEVDGGVCGILVLLPQVDAMLLDNVAVTPAVQGKGFGKTLMSVAEDAARAAGYDRIRLYTNEAMTENIDLYTRLGFRETHRTTEKGLNRVYMEKRVV